MWIIKIEDINVTVLTEFHSTTMYMCSEAQWICFSLHVDTLAVFGDSMGDQEDKCIICEESLGTNKIRTVKDDDIKTLITASLRRKDRKHVKFRKLQIIIVHASCSKLYTSALHIASDLRKLQYSSCGYETSSSEQSDFDFRNLCFFCEEDASD